MGRTMHKTSDRKNLGFVWLWVGVSSTGVAASGQTAFIGVGLGFIALGIAFLLGAGRGARP